MNKEELSAMVADILKTMAPEPVTTSTISVDMHEPTDSQGNEHP